MDQRAVDVVERVDVPSSGCSLGLHLLLHLPCRLPNVLGSSLIQQAGCTLPGHGQGEAGP